MTEVWFRRLKPSCFCWVKKNQAYPEFKFTFPWGGLQLGVLQSSETFRCDFVFTCCLVLSHSCIRCHQFYPLSMTKQSLSLVKRLVFEPVLARSVIVKCWANDRIIQRRSELSMSYTNDWSRSLKNLIASA